ncbi:MAG: deoxyribonuclease IV [Acidobacteriota bacterium]|nr:deoxyribonuclease IV [Acidobacteriota bacterium]
MEQLLIGAHQSIAGGTPRAVERGVSTGCRVLQIFVKNNSRWVGKEISPREAREFRSRAAAASFSHVAAHASYLVNLASPLRALRAQSVAALAEEITRCSRLGIPALVVHPGSHGGEGEAAGVARIAASLDEALSRTARSGVRILVETAAGQGNAVGHAFEHLRDILGAVRHPRRVGICFDTCHVHAAGYDLVSRRGWEETLAAFERTVGLGRLAAIHVNDSKRPRGSRVDRHEHIGRGAIGESGFRNLLSDARLAAVPKFLETPKDESLDFDRKNLETLRRLAADGPPEG